MNSGNISPSRFHERSLAGVGWAKDTKKAFKRGEYKELTDIAPPTRIRKCRAPTTTVSKFYSEAVKSLNKFLTGQMQDQVEAAIWKVNFVKENQQFHLIEHKENGKKIWKLSSRWSKWQRSQKTKRKVASRKHRLWDFPMYLYKFYHPLSGYMG